MVAKNMLKLVASKPVLIFSKKMKKCARVRVIMGSAPMVPDLAPSQERVFLAVGFGTLLLSF